MIQSPALKMTIRLVSHLSLALAVFLMMTPTACSTRSKVEKLHDQGALFHKNRKFYQAVGKFEEALKLEPNRVVTLVMCADAYLQTDNPVKSIEYADRALKLDPERADAQLLVGQGHLRLALQNGKIDENGERQLDTKELDTAAQIVETMRRKDPEAIEGMLLQARIDQLNRRARDAERLYREVLKKEEKNDIARVGLVDTLIAQEKMDEAEQVARAVVEGQEHPPADAVTQYTTVLALRKKYDEAYKVVAPYVSKADPESYFPHFLLAGNVLLAHIGSVIQPQADNDATSETARAMSEGVTAEPQTDALETSQGQVLKQLDPVIKRLASLGTLMKGAYPARPESWFFRGLSFQLQDDLTKATEHFQEALTRAPDSAQYRMALAGAYMQSKQFARARQELKNLLRNSPGNYDARLRMAQCFVAEGSFSDAKGLLRELQRERPQHEQTNELLGRLLVMSDDQGEIDEGLALLAQTAGPKGLAAGAEQFVKGQAALRQVLSLTSQGKTAEAQQQMAEAERLFRQSLELQPTNFMADLMLARLTASRGDLISALHHAKRAAEKNPNFLPLQARLFAKLNQFDAALATYDQILAKSPDALGFQIEKIGILQLKGDTARASQMLDELIAKNPEQSQPLLRKAQMLNTPKTLPQGIAFTKQAVVKFPNDAELQLLLAQMQMASGQPREAAEPMKRIATLLREQIEKRTQQAEPAQRQRALRPLASVYADLALLALLIEEPQNAINHIDQVRQMAPDETQAPAMLDGLARLQLGEFDQAIERFRAVIQDNQNAAVASALVSMALAASGRTEEANASLTDPAVNDNSELLLGRMFANNAPEKLKEAVPLLSLQVFLTQKPIFAQESLKLLDRMTQSLPDEPFVLVRKAEALSANQEPEEALKIYERVVQLMPEFTAVQLAQANMHMALAARDNNAGRADAAKAHRQSAIQLTQQAIDGDSKSVAALNQMADLLLIEGDKAKANDLYRKVIEIDAQNWTAYNNLAWNLAELGNLDEAAQVGQKALELVPEEGGVQDTVGWIEYQRNNLDRATELLSKALMRVPNEPEIRFHLAQALLKQGKTAQGRAELEAITLATPNYARIAEVRQLLK